MDTSVVAVVAMTIKWMVGVEDVLSAEDFLDILTQTVNNFKLDFHRSFEQSRIRRKLDYTLPDNGALTEQYLKVVNTSSAFPSHVLSSAGKNGPIRMWSVIEDPVHYTYLFWGHANGLLVLADFKMTPLGVKASDQVPEVKPLAYYIEKGNGVPFKTQHFLYESYLWLVVAFRSGEREYVAVYQFNPNARTFHRRQTIEMDVKSDFDITTKAGIPYMAVSSYMKRTPVGQTLQTAIKLYEWRHTQFDFIAEQKTYSASSVKLFQMGGILYMAVAQAYNRTTSLETDFYNHVPVGGSTVFLYNSREDEKLTYVQIIPHYATKVTHFRVDGNDYLVFVDPTEISRIYWWAGDQFLIYQDLFETRGAISVAVTRLPNAEILLAFLFKNTAMFFTESDNGKYEPDGQLVIPEKAFVDIQLFSYLKNVNHYFSVFTYDDYMKTPMSAVWRVALISRPPAHQPPETDPLRVCLMKLEQSLTNREDKLIHLTKQADRVWLTNTLQEVKAPVVVRGKVKVNSLTAGTVFLTNGNKKVPQITNTDVKGRVEKLSLGLDAVSNDMNNLVFKSRNQTIVGRTVFAGAISAGHSTVKNIANRNLLLNGISVNTLADNSLQINSNQVINSHLTFNNGLTADNLEVRQLINNLNVSDALLSNWPHPQVVTGNHRYNELTLNADLHLHKQFGSINGIHPTHFVTKLGPNQQIGGKKVFQSLNAKNIDITGTINGRDLSDVAHRAVRLNGANQVISGQWIMEAPINVNNIKIKGLINQRVNLSEMAFNAVTINGEQKITGLKTFRGPVGVLGDLELGGQVNGIKLSRDVITTNTNQVITGNVVFKSAVDFMKGLESESINGMDLSADSVLRNSSRPQFVNRKVFDNTLIVLNDIAMDAGSTLDGVDPSELLKLAISNRDTVFEAPVTFNKLKVGGNIIAKSINQFPVTDLAHILWLKSVNQTIRVPVLFDGPVKVRQLSSPSVNGFRVPADFVHKTDGANEVISGQKRFVGNVLVNGNVDIRDGHRVNGIDLKLFERLSVKKHHKSIDYIRGVKHFSAVRVLGNVITANVNDLNITSDVMLTNRRQTINGNMRLMGPTTRITGTLEVMSNINVKTTVNNYSLSQFANDVVVTNGWPHWHQRPIINKAFAAGIGGQHIIAEGSISGVDINDMKARVVTLNTAQQVMSGKNFTSNTRFNNDLFSDYLNGLKVRELPQRVVLRDHKTTVRGFKTFNGNVILRSNLNLSGTINAIDVQSLQRRLMSRSRDNVIQAPMTFVNDINLGQLSLEAPATIDGLRATQLAFVGHNFTLFGNNLFNRSVSVLRDIDVNKTVNGCDLRQLALNAVLFDTKTHFQSIYGTKEFDSLHVSGNVVINGPINGVDINKLVSRIVSRTGNQALRAPLTFENDVLVDRLIARNLINGINISHVLNDVVLKSKYQTISARKTFAMPVLAKGSRTRVDGYVSVDGVVNGLNVITLNETSVRQHSTQPITGVKTLAGRVTFKRDVFIGGTLSGIAVPNDLILVNTNELISGATRFERWIRAQKGLNVSGLIDGIDLSHFVAHRLTLNGQNELIDSMLNFTNGLSVDNLIVRKTINNIPIEAFVTTNGRHAINGVKTFATDLYVNGNIHSPGVYNNINIHNLANRAISLTDPKAVIPGYTEFTTPVSMRQMHINGLLNGYDISDMATFYNKYTADVNHLLGDIRRQINRQGKALEAQFGELHRDRTSGIDYFYVSQEIYEPDARFLNRSSPRLRSMSSSQPSASLIVSTRDGELFSITANDWTQKYGHNCNEDNNLYTKYVYILRFNGKTYDFYQILDINGVISLDSFQVSNQTYIAAASHLLGTTFLLKYRGYNKFEVIEALPTPGVQNVKSFWTSDGRLHLAIASSLAGQSKTLTAVINGAYNMKRYATIDELLHDHKQLK
ncbi:unnamed protein product [Oppiella nova]|uniref:Uncharacterized protein n=1 Tax=Oppiella nova TaxID=334625 RepID=A0A7R9LK86_9ACAR|nr:unnamed protein product [Oppiella nova]CAG2164475.1 unnamed protein product [Oppiella nova]